MAVTNKSVQIPVEYSTEIIRGVLGRSKALELGRRLRDMRTYELKLNVNKELPVAGWVANSQLSANPEGKEINRKPVGSYAFEGVSITAEELAVIVPIAEATLEDTEDFGIELGAEVQEQIVGAFQEAIDSAVFFGVGSPWSGYTGLVSEASTKGATVAWDGSAGKSFYVAISSAMSYVEKSGYLPNAILGGPSILAAFRDSITDLGVNVADQGEVGRLARHVDLTGGFNEGTAFAVVGDFRYLVYSIRKDMTMKILTEGVIQDPNTGDILYNLGQQDMIALRAVMRLGFALPNPTNRVSGSLSSDGKYIEKGSSSYPFAVITKTSASA